MEQALPPIEKFNKEESSNGLRVLPGGSTLSIVHVPSTQYTRTLLLRKEYSFVNTFPPNAFSAVLFSLEAVVVKVKGSLFCRTPLEFEKEHESFQAGFKGILRV